jgi:hypothetical protein
MKTKSPKSPKSPAPELVEARDLLVDLAAAFASGTYEGLFEFAKTNDVFQRLTKKACRCCRQVKEDPMQRLWLLLVHARYAVMERSK